MNIRTRIALLVAPAVLATGAVLAVTPSAASAALSCNYTFEGVRTYAGHYRGVTTVPSGSSVTSAGAEAQCLLKRISYNPGTIDGVFGPTSRAAMKRWQKHFNDNNPGPDMAEDGWPGPESWPNLREYFLCC